MITRREFGRLGVGVMALAKVSPLFLVHGAEAQDALASGEGADIRRVGVRKNGSYWGQGEEKIDLLSGNLSYSVALLQPTSRGGSSTVRLSYNSQLWKQGATGSKSYGRDTGAGYGWHIQVASVVPKNNDNSIVGYTYVDSTGAEYRLTKNGDTWLSLDGHYITWNPAQSMIWFSNGASMTFASIAGSREPDAGTLYPTLIEDTNGNQILITYLPGSGQTGNNSSGRISQIQDARAGYIGKGQYSYLFLYSAGLHPRLLSITNAVGSSESYSFSYASQQISSPFGQTGEAGSIVNVLQSITHATGQEHIFQYNGYGELVEAQQPHGGILGWNYKTFRFQDGRSIREVSSRSLSDPYSSSNAHTHSFDRDSSDGGQLVHGSSIISGPSGNAQKQLGFANEYGSLHLGHLTSVQELSGGTVVRQRSMEWSTTASGIPYVSSHTVVLDPGTSHQQSAIHKIVKDSYGNLTSHALYDYGSSGTPTRVTTHSYLTDQAYLDKHILNRRLATTVQGNGETLQVRSNQYDTTPLTSRSGLTHHDSASFNAGNTVRGNVTETYVGGVYKRIEYDITGKPASVVDSAGTQVSLVPAEGSNNTLTGMILPNGNENLGAQIQYTAGKPTSVTLPNGNQTTHSYDAIGRLTATTLPSGATVSTAYGTEPSTVTAVVENRWRKTTLNGFAQIVKEEHGNESGTQSTVRYEYGPAANAPVGKLKRQSLPYGAGDKPQWVNSAYDDMGRTISQDLPNTGVPKKISYSGNAVQVTDPAGRWKKIIHNASGKIAKVIMPDANGSSHLETMYSYNALGDLTSVTMPRSNGTQIRRFAYDAGGRVVVRQHAESGKQTRTYNSDGTLASQTDAKGQKHVYTRDTYKRIVSVNRYDAAGALQPNDSYAYYYDTNPFDSSFSQNVQGRLAAVQWGSANTLSGLFTEMYSYTASGQLAAKRLRLNRGTNDADLDIQLSYDTEGRLASIIYPGGSPTLTYTYDSMGRLNGALTSTDSVVKDVAYNSLGQLTDIKLLANNEDQYLSQGYIYNSRNRLTRVLALPENSSDESATLPTVDLEYAYRKDDGKLLAETDHVANKSVSYDYDNHGRILSAQSSDAAWGLGFAYDGFGNRVSQSVTQGQAYAFQVRHDPATNWMLSDDMVYDANGNIVRLPQMDLGYDVQNRMVHMRNSATGEEWYGYDHKNLRIWKKAANGREILSLYEGTKRLATYIVLTDATGNISLKLRESNIFFGRRMVQSGGEVVVLDRLGATRAWSGKRGAGSTKYLPFGEELQRTSDKLNKFGGYERDSASGLDYAEQRYYSSSLGRFITPDPYEKSAHIGSPDTWNRYAFVGNDPVNRVDPHGLNATGADITVPTSELGDDHSFVMQYSDGTSALFLANNTTGDIDVEFEFNTQGVLTDIVGYSAEAGSVNGVPMLYTPDALADILLDDATSYFRDAANNTLLGTIASSIGGPILGGVSEGTQMNAATDTEMAINDEKWAVWILSQSTKQ